MKTLRNQMDNQHQIHHHHHQEEEEEEEEADKERDTKSRADHEEQGDQGDKRSTQGERTRIDSRVATTSSIKPATSIMNTHPEIFSSSSSTTTTTTARMKKRIEPSSSIPQDTIPAHDHHQPTTTNRLCAGPLEARYPTDPDLNMTLPAHPSSSGGSRCSICLDSIIDQTIIEPCQHSDFCFKCLKNWTDRSNRCPLCVGSIVGLIHRIDRSDHPHRIRDFQRFTPLLTILPNLYRDRIEEPSPPSSSRTNLNVDHRTSQRTASIQSTRPSNPIPSSIPNPRINPSPIDSRDRPIGSNSRRRDGGQEVQSSNDLVDDRFTPPRSTDSIDVDRIGLSKRRLIYDRSLYVKHIPSNPFTRFRPISYKHFQARSKMTAKNSPPARDPHLLDHPSSLVATTTGRDSNLIDRTIRFLRRELRALERSLIHSIDYTLRSILLILDSLDSNSLGAIRLFGELMSDVRLAEHFSHELTCFLRSPYEDLHEWDQVLQYPSIRIPPSGPTSTRTEHSQ